MTIMEKFGVPEPQWILDKVEDSGHLVWRRDATENKQRVKFLYHVDVREFKRADHELEDFEWPEEMRNSNHITMAVTAILCLAVTILLPMYMIGIN